MNAAQRHREAQRRHEATQKAAGLKRIRLWVRPEDVAAFQEAARSPHALAGLRAKVAAEVEQEVRETVPKRLGLRTERALLAQAQAEARQHPADSNAPPARVRFGQRPPGTFRRKLREAGWRYDPVAAAGARRLLTALADLTCYAYKKCMKLDWDETKRQTTLRTRGLDFADVDQIEWDKAIVIDDGRRDYGERRQVCLGLLHDQMVVVAYTFRGDAMRVISMRRANRRERRIHDRYRTSSPD